MAGEYLIKVKTVLDAQDARKMEEDLNGRFNRVSEKFGAAMRRGLKKLAVSGIIAGAVGVILNDIEKLNSAIDDTLDKYRDIQSKATAQNLTPAEYYKLGRVSEIAGVQNFDELFNTFRQEMEKVNRGMPSPLAQFRGKPINADTFLQVLSSLQAANPQARQLATQEVFGGQAKEINKLLSVDLNQIAQQTFKGISDEQINEAINRGMLASRQQMILETRRELQNLDVRSRIISGDIVGRQNQYRTAEDQLINKQIGMYGEAQLTQTKMLEAQNKTVEITNKAVGWLDKIYNKISGVISNVNEISRLDELRRTGQISESEYQEQYEDIFK